MHYLGKCQHLPLVWHELSRGDPEIGVVTAVAAAVFC